MGRLLLKYRQCWDIQPFGLGEDYQGIDSDAHGFRLYRMELDGNQKNGTEEYLYEEESSASMKNGQTQYVRVKFSPDQCLIKDRQSVSPQEPRRLSPASQDYGLNALIAFRGRFFLFDYCCGWLSTSKYKPETQIFASDHRCKWRHVEY